jgi:hypothetical protein
MFLERKGCKIAPWLAYDGYPTQRKVAASAWELKGRETMKWLRTFLAYWRRWNEVIH